MLTFKEWRILRGLSQQDLAALLHVTPETISNWERGVCQPSVSQRRHIAEALDITLEEVFRLFPPSSRQPLISLAVSA